VLVREANDLPSDWLVAALKELTRNNGHMTALSRLACLRILVCRDYGINSPSGLPYPQRKKAVREVIKV
jgi:hypothetical protein